jgi:hypothetical protein
MVYDPRDDALRSIDPLEVVPVADDRRLQREFIEFPKRLYQGDPFYVPAFDIDVRALLKKKHPFFEHSRGEFFLLRRGGPLSEGATERALSPGDGAPDPVVDTRNVTVGRFLITDHTRYNEYHGTSFAFFDYLDLVDDSAVAAAAVAAMERWARERGLTGLAGPMLSGGAGGAGVLIDGFDRSPAMTMMRYNYPYYQRLLEATGFSERVDLLSFSVDPEAMRLPERVERLAQIVLTRGHFEVLRFTTKRQIRRVVEEVKELYAATFSHHLEDYPLTPAELDQVEKELLTVIDPRLVTLLAYDRKIVGFAFGFADLSAALRRNRGALGPVAITRILLAMKRTRKILFNGLGILPEYHGLGGNALLYRELARIVTDGGFSDVEMVQISEQTAMMLRDAGTLGGRPSKVHRLYQKSLS